MKRLALIGAVLIAVQWIATLTSQPASAAGLASSPWPDYGGGQRNTHRSNSAAFSRQPAIKWEFDVVAAFNTGAGLPYSPFHQAVLGSDGTLFFLGNIFGSPTGPPIVYAVNSDGTLAWVEKGKVNRFGFWPAVDDAGQVIYSRWLSGAGGSGQIHTRSQTNGTLLWTVRGQDFGEGGFVFDEAQSGPTVGSDGTIYAAEDADVLSAIASDGTPKWQHSGSNKVFINPAIAPNGNIVTDGDEVTAFDSDGSPLWSFPTDSDLGNRYRSVAINATGVIYAGQIGAGFNADKVVALAPDGTEIWTHVGAGGPTAIGPDGTVYATTKTEVVALDPADGHEIWSFQTGAIDEFRVEGVTIDRNGNLFVANKAGQVISLNSGGSLRWMFDLAPDIAGDVLPGAPVIATDGTIYVPGGLTNKIFALHGVPEPSTLTLAALAMLILVVCGWRHRRVSMNA